MFVFFLISCRLSRTVVLELHCVIKTWLKCRFLVLTQAAGNGVQESAFSDHAGDPDAGAPWATLDTTPAVQNVVSLMLKSM